MNYDNRNRCVCVCASVWLCECGDGEKDFVCDQLWRNKYIFVRAPMNSFFFSNAFIILIVTG